ncbi:MAG: Diguanylate cyclase, partial [Cyanobacteriota bacterium erpe_2018_sw_21hr_WHONDRS-SW48-000092_B_bin.40]|nr:Diguanylate cyclase [Cyanobacteriota bacterium erpe_2018_sw_21hr_WHONDRS-SW48-000092_B_bin.40]
MTSDGTILPRFVQLQKTLTSSLRLKDVLDSVVAMFTELAGGAKVAIFLADNESMSFKLMAAKGYTEGSLDQLKIVPFNLESLLKYVYQKRTGFAAIDLASAPD